MELKEFEDKINSITEQFMSLLDSNDVIESSVGNKFESAPKIFESQVNGPKVYHTDSSSSNMTNSYENVSTFGHSIDDVTFGEATNNVNLGGIAYGKTTSNYGNIPMHAVKFDSVEQTELNKKLESLYETKRTIKNIFDEKPTIAFSDSNIGKVNSIGIDTFKQSYTKDKENSTLNNKEVCKMENYNGEENKENTFYSFASIPTDKSLVEKKNWKEVLFMDIPWDTKIDVWGGIKKFCTAQVKITFN